MESNRLDLTTAQRTVCFPASMVSTLSLIHISSCASSSPHITGYAHTQAAASDLVPETCLVMCGLEEAQLDGLLGAMKAAGIIIPLKAIATPHNKGWSLAQLMRELRREREALRPV